MRYLYILFIIIYSINASAQPTTVLIDDDFEAPADRSYWYTNAPAGPWTAPISRSFMLILDEYYFGPYGNQSVFLKLDNLPESKYLSISFDLLIYSSWDGSADQYGPDIWKFKVPFYEDYLIYASFSNNNMEQSFPSNYPGDSYSPQYGAKKFYNGIELYKRFAVYEIRKDFQAFFKDSLEFEFGAELKDTIPLMINESWAIDDLRITIIECKHNDSARVIPLGDTIMCPGDKLELLAYPEEDIISYRWSTGETQRRIIVSDSGKYWVDMFQDDGCMYHREINVEFSPTPYVFIDSTYNLCEDDSVVLKAVGGFAEYLWSTGEKTEEIVIRTPGKYHVIVWDDYGCMAKDTMIVETGNLSGVRILSDKYPEICRGDSLLLTARPNGDDFQFRWNNSSKDSFLVVKEPGEYSVLIANAAGCTGRDTIEVKVNENPEFNILQEKKLCDGDSIKLSPDQDFVAYAWSTGEMTNEIYAKEEGYYSLEVTDSSGCSAIREIFVDKYALPEIVINGDEYICKGDSTVLISENEYESYLWSTGDETRSIETGEQGEYILTVTDTNGCSASGSFEVQYMAIDVDIRAPAGNDFGKVRLGESAKLEFELKNNGIFDAKLENLSIESNESVLNFASNYRNLIINPDDNQTIILNYLPNELSKFDGVLIFTFSEPCPKIDTINFSGRSFISCYARLPFVRVEVDDRDVNIPIFAKINGDYPFNVNIDYEADISYNADCLLPNYYPLDPDYPKIISNEITNFNREISLKHSADISTGETEIGFFKGRSLLGAKDYNTIHFDALDLNNEFIEIDSLVDGALIIEPLCLHDLLAVKRFNALELKLAPNPAEEKLNAWIKNIEFENYSFKIVNIQGRVLENEVSSVKNKKEIKIEIDISCYPSGVYNFILFTESNVLTKQFVKI